MKESKKNLIELIINRGLNGPDDINNEINDGEDIPYSVEFNYDNDSFILTTELDSEIIIDFYDLMSEIYEGGYVIP